MIILDLRPYQQEALTSVIRSFENRVHKQLLVLPTGAGKTCLFIAIIEHYKKRTLVLAHRDELITQTYKKCKSIYPSADIVLYKGKNISLDHQIIISSVQTCSQPQRLEQLKKKNFDILVIDEAHHSISDSYQKIISELGFIDNDNKLLIGVTATPSRSDKKSLSSIFQKIVFEISLDALIKDEYLSPVFARRILTDFSIQGIKMHNKDFVVSQLAEAVNTNARNQFIVKKWKQHATGRKTIAFCVTVQHCKDLADMFNNQGIPAAAVWGDMHPTLRKQILDNFSAGSISIVTSCSLLTEGFDEPSIACIIIARPTKSQPLYVQMVGRGLRKDENSNSTKKDCLVLDFTDKHNSLKTIVSLSDILPDARVITENEPHEKTQTNSNDNKHKIKSDRNIDQEFNILGMPKFIWIFAEGEWSLTDDNKNEIVIQKKNGYYIADIFYHDGMMDSLVSKSTSLRQCKNICEEWVQQKGLTINYSDSNSQWYINSSALPATAEQGRILIQNNSYSQKLNRATASTEIRKIIAASKRQQRNKHGISILKATYFNEKCIAQQNV